jgi:hypothetical protein
VAYFDSRAARAEAPPAVKTLSAALALLLATSVAAVARNDQVGQGQWCWQSESSTVMFCDFSSYASCQSANRGKEPGTCVQKQ